MGPFTRVLHEGTPSREPPPVGPQVTQWELLNGTYYIAAHPGSLPGDLRADRFNRSPKGESLLWAPEGENLKENRSIRVPQGNPHQCTPF